MPVTLRALKSISKKTCSASFSLCIQFASTWAQNRRTSLSRMYLSISGEQDDNAKEARRPFAEMPADFWGDRENGRSQEASYLFCSQKAGTLAKRFDSLRLRNLALFADYLSAQSLRSFARLLRQRVRVNHVDWRQQQPEHDHHGARLLPAGHLLLDDLHLALHQLQLDPQQLLKKLCQVEPKAGQRWPREEKYALSSKLSRKWETLARWAHPSLFMSCTPKGRAASTSSTTGREPSETPTLPSCTIGWPDSKSSKRAASLSSTWYCLSWDWLSTPTIITACTCLTSSYCLIAEHDSDAQKRLQSSHAECKSTAFDRSSRFILCLH